MKNEYLFHKVPKDLLMVFLTAGADVYATNNYGKTPSEIAFINEREDEWIEALLLCGYNAAEVIADSDPDLKNKAHKPQTSKLTFKECCRGIKKKIYRYKYGDYGAYWDDVEQAWADVRERDLGCWHSSRELKEAICADRKEFHNNHQDEYEEAKETYRRIYGEHEVSEDYWTEFARPGRPLNWKMHGDQESERSEDHSTEFVQQRGDDPRIEELGDVDTSSPSSTGEVLNHRTELDLENPSNIHAEGITEDLDHSDGIDVDGGERSDFAGMDSNFDNGWSLESNNMEGMILSGPQDNSFASGMDFDFDNDWQQNNASSAAFGGSFQDDGFAPETGDFDFDFDKWLQDYGVGEESGFAGLDLSPGGNQGLSDDVDMMEGFMPL